MKKLYLLLMAVAVFPVISSASEFDAIFGSQQNSLNENRNSHNTRRPVASHGVQHQNQHNNRHSSNKRKSTTQKQKNRRIYFPGEVPQIRTRLSQSSPKRIQNYREIVFPTFNRHAYEQKLNLRTSHPSYTRGGQNLLRQSTNSGNNVHNNHNGRPINNQHHGASHTLTHSSNSHSTNSGNNFPTNHNVKPINNHSVSPLHSSNPVHALQKPFLPVLIPPPKEKPPPKNNLHGHVERGSNQAFFHNHD